MRFLYEYRTPDNEKHQGEIRAADKEAAYAALKKQGIKPCRFAEAPGLFNKLFGKGKRWIAIFVLCAFCIVLCAVVYRQDTRREAQGTTDRILDSTMRRQVIGDSGIIEKGIRTGWADVFELEGERFLASFAVPAAQPAVRSTTEDELRKSLSAPRSALRTSHSLEERQIRAMVEGMKEEARRFLSNGGTIQRYGQRLVERQEFEVNCYNRIRNELDAIERAGKTSAELEAIWEDRNAKLRRMGIRLVPMPE